MRSGGGGGEGVAGGEQGRGQRGRERAEGEEQRERRERGGEGRRRMGGGRLSHGPQVQRELGDVLVYGLRAILACMQQVSSSVVD